MAFDLRNMTFRRDLRPVASIGLPFTVPESFPDLAMEGESAYEAPHYHRRVRRIRAVTLLLFRAYPLP